MVFNNNMNMLLPGVIRLLIVSAFFLFITHAVVSSADFEPPSFFIFLSSLAAAAGICVLFSNSIFSRIDARHQSLRIECRTLSCRFYSSFLLFISIAVLLVTFGAFSVEQAIGRDAGGFKLSVVGHVIYEAEGGGGPEIVKSSGTSFYTTLHTWIFLTSGNDSRFSNSLSDLILFEDGEAISKPHSLHSDIQSLGGGRYSHWGRFGSSSSTLYFSSSDNTDPRVNGREYTLRYTPGINPYVQVLLFVAVMAWVGRYAIPYLRNRGVADKVREYSPVLLLAVFFIFSIIYIFPLFQTWYSGNTDYALIAGYLPWTDAHGWAKAAKQLLHTGVLMEWSERRPLNPGVHAVMASVTGEKLNWTLLLYALLAFVSSLYCAIELAKSYGIAAGLYSLGVLAYFASDFIDGTMSETLGMIYGCSGFAVMWYGVRERSVAWYSAGLMIFTVGMSARPGPLLVLPLLALWAAFGGGFGKRWSWRALFFAGVAVLCGLIPSFLIGFAYGGGENAPASNFAYVLYGLSLGGEPWMRGYSDFPQYAGLLEGERTKLVFHAAIDAITSNPGLFFHGAWKYLTNYFVYYLAYIHSDLLRSISKYLAIIGMFSLFINWKKPHSTFLLSGLVGMLLSAPVIFWDYDAYRAYIVTSCFDAALIAAGLGFSYQILRDFRIYSQERGISSFHGVTWYSESIMFMVIFLLMLSSLAPFIAVEMYKSPRFSSVSCSDGEDSAILHIGHSSPYVRVVNDNEWSIVPDVSKSSIDGIQDVHEYGLDERIKRLSIGDMLIWGYDLSSDDSRVGWFFSSEGYFSSGDGYYLVCGVRENLDENGAYWVFSVSGAQAIDPV